MSMEPTEEQLQVLIDALDAWPLTIKAMEAGAVGKALATRAWEVVRDQVLDEVVTMCDSKEFHRDYGGVASDIADKVRALKGKS